MSSEKRPLLEDEKLTPDELRSVVSDQLRNVRRETALRETELMEILTGLEAGKLTPDEATRRYYEYFDRWQDAFRGFVETTDRMSDREVLKRYEDALERHGHQLGRRLSSGRGTER
jgi:hypothetical protein